MMITKDHARSILPTLFLLFLFGCTTPLYDPAGPTRTTTGEERLYRRAEAAYRKGDLDGASQHYQAYLSRFPGGRRAPDAMMRQGDILKAQQAYEEARTQYQAVLEGHPDSPLAPHAMLQILQTFLEEGDHDTVLRKANQFLNSPVSADHQTGIYLIIGDSYVAEGSFANAVYFYADAVARHDVEHPAYLNRGVILDRLKTGVSNLTGDELLSLLSRVRNDTARSYLLYQVGLGEIAAGRYEDAGRTFTQFLSLYPDHEYGPEARQYLQDMEMELPNAAPPDSRPLIGCLLPLSGSYQVYGQKALRGIELAVRNAGDRVQLVVRDTGSQPDKAVIAVQELAVENVSAIIGPIITAEAAAAAADESGIPIIVLTQKPGIAETGEYVFRHFLTPRMQVDALVRHTVGNQGIRRFGILYPDEKYGQTFKDIFIQTAQSAGADVVAVAVYGVDQVDFTEPIKSLIRQGGFEALFIPDAPSKVGLIIPQLAFYDVSRVQLLGTNLWHSEKLIHEAGKFAQGAVFPDIFFPLSPSPQVRNFVQAFEQTYDAAPTFIEALSYDTANILIDVLSWPQVNGPGDVREALLNRTTMRGVTGPTRFGPFGEAEKELYLLKIEGESFSDVHAGGTI